MRLFLAAAFALSLLAPPALAQGLVVPENGFVVSDDLSQLPPAVAEKRAALIDAAMSGDIENLRPILDAEPSPVTVSFGEPEDLIEYLKRESADGEGLEILAVLLDILDAPFAAQDGGDGSVSYVWPYLASIEGLGEVGAVDRIEGIRIMGAEDFQMMQEFGVWIYWRVFINEDGRLQAFVAGD